MISNDGPAKKLIYECTLELSEDIDVQTNLQYLEYVLQNEADYQRWCPDWTYQVDPAEEENVFNIKVYGEFEEDSL